MSEKAPGRTSYITLDLVKKSFETHKPIWINGVKYYVYGYGNRDVGSFGQWENRHSQTEFEVNLGTSKKIPYNGFQGRIIYVHTDGKVTETQTRTEEVMMRAPRTQKKENELTK